jgi:hypothetical protein
MVPNHAQCVRSMSGQVYRSNSAAMSVEISSTGRNTAYGTGNTANLAWLS